MALSSSAKCLPVHMRRFALTFKNRRSACTIRMYKDVQSVCGGPTLTLAVILSLVKCQKCIVVWLSHPSSVPNVGYIFVFCVAVKFKMDLYSS